MTSVMDLMTRRRRRMLRKDAQYMPLSIRTGGRRKRLLWKWGFSYETCHRWG